MLFNLIGYKVFFSYLNNKAVTDMVQQLDKNTYAKTGLIEIKIPLHLPYTTNTNGFERYDGTIQLNGVYYNYVERKITDDSLILHCLPNRERDVYSDAENKYTASVNDLQCNTGNRKNTGASLLIKGMMFVYYQRPAQWQPDAFAASRLSYTSSAEQIPAHYFYGMPGKPPQSI